MNTGQFRRLFFWPPPKLNAPRLCSCDAFCLPLMNELAFGLRHIRKQLQNDVCNQRPRQVSTFSGIQQRHIKHNDCRRFFLCNDAPLLQNFLIISPKAVDALDNKRIAAFQFANQPPVLCPLGIFSCQRRIYYEYRRSC